MRLIGSGTLIAISALLFFVSCYHVPKDIEPKIHTSIQDRYLKELSSPFTELTTQEKNTSWGSEYLIGIHFARNLDLYRAITAFRRAEILYNAQDAEHRQLEIQYEILLCYYLGGRYEEVDQTFGQSDLAKVGSDFPAYHDLLIILYDTYDHLSEPDKACHILELIKEHSPETYDTLAISTAMRRADFDALECIIAYPTERTYLNNLLDCYDQKKKSPATAAALNAFLPGSGYLYLGQKQTAVTAFLVNGLFIASSVYFFKNGPIAAGIVTTSFEAGWYFGGIQGAALQAKCYNERLYERMASPEMNQNKLFPVFQLNYAF
ncbi:MAG: hypothetical protein K1000chlam2_01136 [Chlamydiae bacterium]|nr:hypothetical protein [Chlamydiota bacterium]